MLSFFWDDLKGKTPWYSDPVLTGGRHFYTAYFTRREFKAFRDPLDPLLLDDWPPSKGWYTLQTDRNVYTNLMFVSTRQAGMALPPKPGTLADQYTGTPAPALGVGWAYQVDETSRSLSPMVNRPSLLAVRARIVARTYPEEFRLPPWWDAIDLTSDDPADLPALRSHHALPGARSPAFPGREPPNALAAPPGLRRSRVRR